MYPRKVKTQGTCRKGGRGIPSDVTHQEVTSIKGQREVTGTVKAAVLQCDTECPEIVASIIYDTRPINFISTGYKLINWVIKSKRVYNVDSG